MANWEKLIEEHYSKKNKIDENTIFELIEQALIAEGYQDSEVIKNHPSMRLSTKGTKKAGGEPYDEDPPKKRSKSAPAGFGVLEEIGLEEATIRDSRKFYYVNPQKIGSDTFNKIQNYSLFMYSSGEGEYIEGKKELVDRVYAVQTRDDSGSEIKYLFDLFLLPEPVKAKYGLRGLVMQSNSQDSAVSEMEGAKKIYTYERINVKPGITKVTWLQTKPEELRAENEHLGKIKSKFIKAGIGDDPKKGLKPATIIVKPTHGSASTEATKFENVVGIDKIMSKGAVGDFGLFVQGNDVPVFTISHKALGFERYAALKQTLKELQKSGEGAAAKSFMSSVAKKWTEGALKGERSTKGYYQKVSSADFAKEVVYFIYGTGSRKADSLFVGEISLTKVGDNRFALSVESVSSSGGDSECLIYDTLPSTEEYMPIFKSRQGSNGSWVYLGDYGESQEEKKQNQKEALTILTNMVNIGDDGGPPKMTIQDLEAMSYAIEHEQDEITGAIIITSAKLSVRYYVSPARRSDGAEEIVYQK